MATMVSSLGGLILQRFATSGELAAGVIGQTPAARGNSDVGMVLALFWALAVALAAFAWTQRRQAQWDRSLALLTAQARSVAEGRFDMVSEGCVEELLPLARTMNAMSMRLRGVFVDEGRPAETLRRQAQPDPATGLDNRAVFLQRLTERLGDPSTPDGALLVVRLQLPDDSPGTPGDDQAHRILEAMSDVLRNYPLRVPGSFLGRLNERDFALYLPAHGLASETATTLLARGSGLPDRQCTLRGRGRRSPGRAAREPGLDNGRTGAVRSRSEGSVFDAGVFCARKRGHGIALGRSPGHPARTR